MATPLKLPVLLYPGEDGAIVAECPLIPGCISQGKTRDAALTGIREAIELCLERRESEGWKLPQHVEVVEVSTSSCRGDFKAYLLSGPKVDDFSAER